MKNSKIIVAVLFVVMNLVVLAPTTSYAGKKFFEFPTYERIEVPQYVKDFVEPEDAEALNNSIAALSDDERKELFLELSRPLRWSSATTFIAMDTKYLVEYCNFVDNSRGLESGSAWREVKSQIEGWINSLWAIACSPMPFSPY